MNAHAFNQKARTTLATLVLFLSAVFYTLTIALSVFTIPHSLSLKLATWLYKKSYSVKNEVANNG